MPSSIGPPGKVIQMTGRQASKYHAIEWIRQQRHWQPDEIIAVFGDDQNDVPMLAAYENSVAMADGCKAARQAARFVTRSHEKTGSPMAYLSCCTCCDPPLGRLAAVSFFAHKKADAVASAFSFPT